MKKLIIIIAIAAVMILPACKKYLDVKSDAKLAVPSTLADLQSIFDYRYFHGFGVACTDDSGDDYYLTADTYNSLYADYMRGLYTWQNSNIFYTATLGSDAYTNDWSLGYYVVYNANAVLGYLDKFTIKPEEQQQANDIRGQALFHRGRMYLQLVVAFSKGYNAATASNDLGVPLRLSTDFNQQIPRSSVEATYQQILQDLKKAIALLPNQSIHVQRPVKAAAYGMLARTYLSMRDYENSRLYADSCLRLRSILLDYNTITNTDAPFEQFHVPEIIYDSAHSLTISDPYYAFVDSTLMQLYDKNDLRKSLYFTHNDNDTYKYKASYEGPPNGFDGIATDEMYLIRAEGYARKGDLVPAMQDLDALLQNRYSKSVPYVNHIAANQQQAINWILAERRKELLFRGLRWMDIKRLNLEGANIMIKRVVNGTTYTLPPNSLRYAIPIPDDVIKLSGIQQNQY